MKMAKSVEEYIESQEKYGKSLELLREILCETELEETVKWGIPTYTINKKNVVGIGAFKTHFGLWFFNGVFLSDPHNCLINAQEGKTKGMRQMRFTSNDDIDRSIVLDYTLEAIENQKKGLEIKPEKKPLIIPEELEKVFNENKELAAIFESLTLTKRREFAEHVASAKREETRQKRLEKIIPMILNNIGLNDKYR
ncbi:MAG: YdeI/OmpD-associated family protein [Flavobacteriaceae bacterium]|nr:YdeI/OmpD-associated family protein [Flavobacteriaceae bacterium]